MTHTRNVGPMINSPRCGAKTRKGSPCKAPSVRGRRRCRLHGGAPGSGAPKGNKNALKTGLYTKAAIEDRKQLSQLIKIYRETLEELT